MHVVRNCLWLNQMSYRVQRVDDEFVSNKNKKDKAGVKYPKKFSKKVNMGKVNFAVVEKWIGDTLNEQLPDDDVVIDYVGELLQAEDEPDIKMIHLQMQDFLGQEQAMKFCETLWDLLISAQEDPDGIPAQLLEQRRKEYEVGEDNNKLEKPKTNYNRSGRGQDTAVDAKTNGDKGHSDKGKGRSDRKNTPGQNRRHAYRNTRDDRDLDPQDIRASKNTGYRDDKQDRSYRRSDNREYDNRKG